MKRLAVILALLFAGTVEAQCPTNYVLVPNEATYSLGNFCVAKYEMKEVGGVATSQASGTPWVSITRAAAFSACSALGAPYHAINRSERMVIARNIEATASNWSTGMINRGHSDNSPANTLAASADDNAACEGTEQTCSSTVWDLQRRTHTLSNGAVIWDFAGNVFEWLDWTITNTDKASPQSAWIEITASTPTTSMPKSGYWPLNESLTKENGIGSYYPGLSGFGGVVFTGGGYTTLANAGIYTVMTNYSTADSLPSLGFRCAMSLDYGHGILGSAARSGQSQIVETRQYGQATVVDFSLYDIIGANLKTNAVDGGLDCSIIKDEGIETACTNDFVDEGSTYSIALTALEMTAKRITVCIVDADSPDVYLPRCFRILTTASGF